MHCSLHIVMLVLHTFLYQRSLFAAFMERHVAGDAFVAVNRCSVSYLKLKTVCEQPFPYRWNIREFKSLNPTLSRSVNAPIALKA